MSARQVLDAPLPPDAGVWQAAQAPLRRAVALTVDDGIGLGAPGDDEAEHEWRSAMVAFGTLMCEAYGVGPEVLAWWQDRLPQRGGGRARSLRA